MWKTKFTPKVVRQDDRKVRVEIWNEEEEVGTLYYETPKVGWKNKPLSTNHYVCVDAHIEQFAGLIKKDSPNVKPKEIIEWGNEAIKKASL
jgi:hypothetical protein